MVQVIGMVLLTMATVVLVVQAVEVEPKIVILQQVEQEPQVLYKVIMVVLVVLVVIIMQVVVVVERVLQELPQT